LIYITTDMSPKNEARNMSVDQVFSCKINGTSCTDYQLEVYNNKTGAIIYDSGMIHLATPLYDKAMLYHTIPAGRVALGLDCKWIITVSEIIGGKEQYATCGEIFFKSMGSPVVSLTVPATITSQSYTPIATYSHPQNVAVKKFKYFLYDNTDYLLAESDYIYSGSIKYTFDGLLHGNTYKIKCTVVDQNDATVSTTLQSFSVAYSQPNVDIVPLREILSEKSAAKITWGKVVQIAGTTTGAIEYTRLSNNAINLLPTISTGSLIETRNSTEINPMEIYNYAGDSVLTAINTFNKWGNGSVSSANINQLNEVQIDNNFVYKVIEIASLKYGLTIPAQFNLKFKIKFSDGFKGIFCSFGTNDEYKIGYNGTKFYFNNKGSICYSEEVELPTGATYVDIRPTDVFVGTTRIGF